MRSFFEHVPERYHETLRQAIEAVTETKYMLDQVLERFGTRDPAELERLLGQEFEGIPVTEQAVAELAELVRMHEARRQACQSLMTLAARGEAIALDGGEEDA